MADIDGLFLALTVQAMNKNGKPSQKLRRKAFFLLHSLSIIVPLSACQKATYGIEKSRDHTQSLESPSELKTHKDQNSDKTFKLEEKIEKPEVVEFDNNKDSETSNSNPTSSEKIIQSDKFKYLERNDSERKHLVEHHNLKLKNRLESIPGSEKFYEWIKTKLDVENVLLDQAINDTDTLVVKELGLNKASTISMRHKVDEKESSEILYDFGDQLSSKAEVIIEAKLSPNKSHVGILISAKGSTDLHRLKIFDINKKVFIKRELLTVSDSWSWDKGDSIFFQDRSVKESTLSKYIIATDVVVVLDKKYKLKEPILSPFIYAYDNKHLQFTQDCGPIKIVAATKDFNYILCRSKDGYRDIRRFRTDAETIGAGEIIVPEMDFLINRVFYSDETLFLESIRGEDRRIRVHTLTGKRLSNFQIPTETQLVSVQWKEKHTSLSITLTSVVKSRQTFNYHLKNREWNLDPSKSMLEVSGIQYISETLLVKSSDGRNFPIRISRRADLQKNSNNPVLIKSYGGFNNPGYFGPSYNILDAEFLRRGGILVGPALRGGNEIGPLWHKEAHYLSKEKTYDDLAATARFMLSEKWTKVSKIASFGASNGGLTVTATALLHPNLFGLVIPLAGVLDLIGKDRLDAPFNNGWSHEYGSYSKDEAKAHLKKISPLENVKNYGQTRFLVLTGDSDSRVNPAHSIKFVGALKAAGASDNQVDLLTLKDAGHFMTSRNYSNSRAVDSNFHLWATIYEQVFETPFVDIE